jgi:hypothetical protein
MICRQCGTEIADKAIICYRCGTATTDPVRRPAAIRRRRSLGPLVALVLLVLLGLFLGQAGRTATSANAPALRIAAAVCLGVALVLLIVRVVRRK